MTTAYPQAWPAGRPRTKVREAWKRAVQLPGALKGVRLKMPVTTAPPTPGEAPGSAGAAAQLNAAIAAARLHFGKT